MLLNAALGAGSELIIDVAAGVDWTAAIAVVYGIQQARRSLQLLSEACRCGNLHYMCQRATASLSRTWLQVRTAVVLLCGSRLLLDAHPRQGNLGLIHGHQRPQRLCTQCTWLSLKVRLHPGQL